MYSVNVCIDSVETGDGAFGSLHNWHQVSKLYKQMQQQIDVGIGWQMLSFFGQLKLIFRIGTMALSPRGEVCKDRLALVLAYFGEGLQVQVQLKGSWWCAVGIGSKTR